MNKIYNKLFVALTVVLLWGAQANALTMLPDPSIQVDPAHPEYGTLGQMYGDFLAYSTYLNNQYYGLNAQTGQYAINAGTGQNGVIVYTQAGGNTNKDINNAYGTDFPVPLESGSGATSFSGTWYEGKLVNNPNSGTGRVNVSDVLTLLHGASGDPGFNTPEFVFDMSQSQGYIEIMGFVHIIDSVKGLNDYFYFNNGMTPPGAVQVPAKFNIGPYPIDNSGKGKADYIAYIPSLDLLKYDPTAQFQTYFYINGFGTKVADELFLGAYMAPYTPPVPEPGTFVLLGSGLLGLAVYGKRRMNKG